MRVCQRSMVTLWAVVVAAGMLIWPTGGAAFASVAIEEWKLGGQTGWVNRQPVCPVERRGLHDVRRRGRSRRLRR